MSDSSRAPLHWTSFADDRMARTLRRIAREARAMNAFDGVHPWRQNDLAGEFLRRWATFISASPRGFGYWIWKPYVIERALALVPEGGFLLYTDAGCTLNKEGVPRLREYLALLDAEQRDVLAFELPLLERAWTKADLLRGLEFEQEAAAGSRQLLSGIMVIRSSARGREFVRRWRAVMEEDPHWIDDSPSSLLNAPEFVEHRHDQSVFSIVARQAGALVLPDETWWPARPWPKEFPVHATRIKHIRPLPVRVLLRAARPVRRRLASKVGSASQ